MKQPDDGEKESLNPTWTTISSHALFGTITTKTLWLKYTGRDMLINLTLLAWLRPFSPQLLIRQRINTSRTCSWPATIIIMRQSLISWRRHMRSCQPLHPVSSRRRPRTGQVPVPVCTRTTRWATHNPTSPHISLHTMRDRITNHEGEMTGSAIWTGFRQWWLFIG